MSYDLAVWSKDAVSNDKDATALYVLLCDNAKEGVAKLPATPAIEKFYRELTGLHPEIGDVPDDRVDDTEFSPWSATMDRSDRHVIMCAVWSRAGYVAETVPALAKKHGLAVFDPQGKTLLLP